MTIEDNGLGFDLDEVLSEENFRRGIGQPACKRGLKFRVDLLTFSRSKEPEVLSLLHGRIKGYNLLRNQPFLHGKGC